MAMLAEPRRRKKYNLCPRGKALYEDSARFGTKMLEKMGWSKGRGLGANEDGSQDFVRVRFKNDAEGLGYENRDDQWTIHEEGFNGLLNSLNGGSADDAPNTNDNSGAASASEDEARPMGFGFREATPEKKVKSKTLKNNISGVSLEEKSKQSKARVHYKKFTRGKDLSRYSEKDLANIFGKKATEDIDAPVEPVVPAEQQPAEEEEKPVDPNFAGVHTVSTGLSVNDYFKQKMEAMKNRLKNNSFVAAEEATPLPNGDGEAAVNDAEEVEETAQPEKKKKKSKRAKKEEEETVIESSPVKETASKIKKKKKSKEVVEEAEAEPEVEAEIVSVKEKKEKKKSKRAAEEEQSELTEEKPPLKKKSKNVAEEGADELEVDPTDVNEVKQKKSKRAPEEDAEQAQAAVEATPSEESATKEKTKKKSKRAAEETATVEQQPESEVEAVSVEAVVKEKKKKSKRAAEEIKEKQQPEPEVKSVPSEEATSKEKKKKSKRAAEADAIELEQQVEEAEETSQPKRKKKKKDKQDDDVDVNATKEIPVEEETNKKSKKKKKPENHENVEVSAESSSSDADTDSDNSQYLSYEELIKKRDSFNVCPISSFCAEKFYIFDMKAYRNSTIAHITGYDVDENIKLKVVQAKNDNLRIFNLWEGKTSKYLNEPKVGITKPKHKHKAAVRAVKKRQLFSGI